MGVESGENSESGKEKLSDDVYFQILADNGLKEYLENLASRVAVVKERDDQPALEVQSWKYVPAFVRFREAMMRVESPLTDRQILLAVCRFLDPNGDLGLEDSVN